MAQQAQFGRRASTAPPRPKPVIPSYDAAKVERRTPASAGAAPARAAPPPGHDEVSLDEELAQWKAARKARKRSFREPWRSVSIAATLMFALGTWLLPDQVANIVQVLLLALGAASLYAGFRKTS
jgi:hypothetical protein